MAVSVVDLNPPRRSHSSGERVADACVHALGLVASVVGAIILVRQTATRDPGKIGSISVYALCLVAMVSASAAYNIGYHTRYRPLFRRCDHAAIFLLIAGTYTPFTMHMHAGALALDLTATIWMVACAGVGMKFRAPVQFEKWSDSIYLGLGWMSIPVLWPIASSLPGDCLALVMIGGAIYSVGVIFHRWEGLTYHNAIWHVFVLVAAGCHYESILTGVVLTRS